MKEQRMGFALRLSLLVLALVPTLTLAAGAFKTTHRNQVFHCADSMGTNQKYHCTVANTSQCWKTGTARAGSTGGCGTFSNKTYCTEFTYFSCPDGTSFTTDRLLGCVNICR